MNLDRPDLTRRQRRKSADSWRARKPLDRPACVKRSLNLAVLSLRWEEQLQRIAPARRDSSAADRRDGLENGKPARRLKVNKPLRFMAGWRARGRRMQQVSWLRTGRMSPEQRDSPSLYTYIRRRPPPPPRRRRPCRSVSSAASQSDRRAGRLKFGGRWRRRTNVTDGGGFAGAVMSAPFG